MTSSSKTRDRPTRYTPGGSSRRGAVKGSMRIADTGSSFRRGPSAEVALPFYTTQRAEGRAVGPARCYGSAPNPCARARATADAHGPSGELAHRVGYNHSKLSARALFEGRR